MKNGVLEPSAIVTHRLPLAEIADGDHRMSSKLAGCIKPLLRPPTHQRRRTAMPYTVEKPRVAHLFAAVPWLASGAIAHGIGRAVRNGHRGSRRHAVSGDLG